MAKTLIGLGGTGAKVLEAFTYLTLMGYPVKTEEKCHVRMVDYDNDNGNIDRLEKLLSIINKDGGGTSLSKLLENIEGYQIGTLQIEHEKIENNGPSSKIASEFLWKVDLADVSIGDTLQLLIENLAGGSDVPNLAQALYSENDRSDPNSGFYAKPYQGVLRFDAEFGSDNQHFIELEKCGAFEGEIKMAFIGSFFGGTGASGIPVLIKNVDEFIRKDGDTKPFKPGMLMMLPYYTYKPDPNSLDNVPDPNLFMQNTKLALMYYSNIIKNEEGNISVDVAGNPDFTRTGVFKRVSTYLIGRDVLSGRDMQEINDIGEIVPVKIAGRGSIQKNPPLPEELAAALSVVHYLNGNSQPGNIYMCGDKFQKEDNIEITFHYFSDEAENLRAALNRLIMFTLVWKIISAKWHDREVGFLPFKYFSVDDKLNENLWNKLLSNIDDFVEKSALWLGNLEVNGLVLGFRNKNQTIDSHLQQKDLSWSQCNIDFNGKTIPKILKEIDKKILASRDKKQSSHKSLLHAVLKVCWDCNIISL